MNIFLYIIIFTMGTLFGSFYTLAVYRIPKKLDIVHTHSFCPNCNHKLGFFELIPVWSYVFQRGRCKNCHQKIRPRYFILEILSGITFLLIAFGLKIDANNLKLGSIIKFVFFVMYIAPMFIIAGIDKEKREIEKSVLYYSILTTCAYIIYLCIMDQTSIYRYVMYLTTFVILLIIDTRILLTKAKDDYIIQCLFLILIMVVNTGEIITSLTVLIVLISILAVKFLYFIKNYFDKSKKEYIDSNKLYCLGFLLIITNVSLEIVNCILFNALVIR